MLTFSDAEIRSKIRSEQHQNADLIAFLPFQDLLQSVWDDIALIRQDPLVLDVSTPGYIYKIETGKITKVDVD